MKKFDFIDLVGAWIFFLSFCTTFLIAPSVLWQLCFDRFGEWSTRGATYATIGGLLCIAIIVLLAWEEIRASR